MSSIIVQDPSRLSIRIPRAGFKATGSAYAEATRERGSLVDGLRASEWRLESLDETGSDVLFSGPAFEGESLDGPCGPDRALDRIRVVAEAFAVLSRDGRLPSVFISPGILVSSGGRVLVLPPSIVSRAFSFVDAAERDASIALASPRGGGSEAEASFFLAQAVYRAAAGSSAYAPAGPDRKAPAAGEPFVPLSLACPRLDRRLSALADLALADPARASTAEWAAALGAAAAEGAAAGGAAKGAEGSFFREIGAAEAEEAARKKAAVEALIRRKRARALFLKKRGGLLLGAAIALAVVGVFAGSMLQSAASRPDYSSYEPRRLVETYYSALGDLDIESLEACTEKTARDDSTYVINLSVITKTRLAYEGRNPLVQARDWLAGGAQALPDGAFLYGIVGLSIGEARATAERATFVVEYSLWTMDRSGEAAAPQEIERRDELTLARGKKGWKIVAIDREGS